ncbi:MAG: hypothetical protein F6J95_007495 [Leptolyngbya sp. SIO1E4]|nr:hypothetical protein [Leptolyngbya sp. SIO1E4]
MARSLEQILRDLEALAAATTRIDQEIKELYKQYLEVLGKAVKRQLILAAYHLCTQIYPEAFLKLSVNQREKVQGGIRKIADQGRTQVEQLGQLVAMGLVLASSEKESSMSGTTTDTPLSETANTGEGDVIAADNSGAAANARTTEDEKENAPTADKDDAGDDDSAAESSDQTAMEASEIAQRLSSSLSLFAALEADPLSPINLAKRHVLLERQLRAILHTVSNLANYLLKQARVLPDLPEMVIAAAAEAEAGEPGPSTPNLLNVLVEMESDRAQNDSGDDKEAEDNDALSEEDPEGSMTHLVAVNLRLADIEFADTHAALWRSKLQEILARLKRLSSQYQKLQREKARAEAEYAWRATWFEE